jgi:hypothetical protein
MMNGAPFQWFTDDDVEIVGDDVCSRCLKAIQDDEVPLMLFRQRVGKTGRNACDIARFHWPCAEELFRLGVIKLGAAPGQ